MKRETKTTMGLALILATAMLGFTACPFFQKSAGSTSVTPSRVDFGAGRVETVVNLMPVTPDAAGLTFSATTAQPWIDVLPNAGTLAKPGVSTPLTIAVARAHMKPGLNRGTVSITIDGEEAHEVAVRADAVLTADFVASPTEALENQPIAFSDKSNVLTGAAPIERWYWEFGDRTASTERNPVHTYTTQGRYTVKLTVESTDLSDTRTRHRYVRVRKLQGPIADFAAATHKPTASLPVQFSDISAPGTSPITSWLWDFGDGGWSALQDPVHIYTAATVYDVYLTVTTAQGPATEIKFGYIDVQAAPTKRRSSN